MKNTKYSITSLLTAFIIGQAISAAPSFANESQVPAVVVSAQPIERMSVTIDSVTAPQDGWLVIHQSQPDGSVVVPQSIGQAAVTKGNNTNVTVNLDTNVASDSKLWAMLHVDEGEKGVYEFPGADKPVKMDNMPVMQSFEVGKSFNRQDGVVRAFGPGGPDAPIRQAAEAFTKKTGIPVEVTYGSEATWTEAAQQKGDLLFGSSEQSMTAFLETYKSFNINEVEPIYLRPAIAMVQSGNPKNIQGIEDLMKPGMRIVVTSGAGVSNTSGTGVWEDIVGRTGSIEDLQAFRKNIVYFAPNSGSGFKTFKDPAAEIDAWITWNHWVINHPDAGDAVEIEPERRIYRDANVVVAEGADPETQEFINFLKSDEGAEIFARNGWSR